MARGRPFQKGCKSPHPSGRPKGVRNKATLLIEALFDGEAEKLTAKLIERAHAGDMTALSLCMKYILPSGRKRRVEIDLPPLVTAADCLNALAILVAATARGEITGEEAQQFAYLVELCLRALTNVDVEQRLKKLEEAVASNEAQHLGKD